MQVEKKVSQSDSLNLSTKSNLLISKKIGLLRKKLPKAPNPIKRNYTKNIILQTALGQALPENEYIIHGDRFKYDKKEQECTDLRTKMKVKIFSVSCKNSFDPKILNAKSVDSKGKTREEVLQMIKEARMKRQTNI